jgi:glutamate 5-kinase
VVKLGTGVLTDSRKQIEPAQLEQIVAQVAALRKAGKEVVVVTSGAVGAGMGALGFDTRPADLAEKQACAAVGQSRLMSTYEKLFAKHDLVVAQVLLTHDDLEHHERHLNARNTLVTLLGHGVVPIINENDAVSFTEIKVGDNDTLSALVASLLPADLLVILTTVDGVIKNFGQATAKVISTIGQIDADLEKIAGGTTSETAVGGMATKIQAAKIVVRSGIPLVIASGRKQDALSNILAGADEGTLFIAQEGKLRGRKRWIAFGLLPMGKLYIDAGAVKALCESRKSLLAAGITQVEGEFMADDAIQICNLEGKEIARGLANYSRQEIEKIKGHHSEEIAAILGYAGPETIVHRDNLVLQD